MPDSARGPLNQITDLVVRNELVKIWGLLEARLDYRSSNGDASLATRADVASTERTLAARIDALKPATSGGSTSSGGLTMAAVIAQFGRSIAGYVFDLLRIGDVATIRKADDRDSARIDGNVVLYGKLETSGDIIGDGTLQCSGMGNFGSLSLHGVNPAALPAGSPIGVFPIVLNGVTHYVPVY